MFLPALETLIYVWDVSGEVSVGPDVVVEVGADAVRAGHFFVDGLDETPQSSADPFWHNQPLQERRGRAKHSRRYRVLVHRYLIERRNEVEERTHRISDMFRACRGFHRLRGQREVLAKDAWLSQLLVTARDADATGVLRCQQLGSPMVTWSVGNGQPQGNFAEPRLHAQQGGRGET